MGDKNSPGVITSVLLFVKSVRNSTKRP